MKDFKKFLERVCGVLVWIPTLIAVGIGGFFVLPQMPRYLRIRNM